MAITSIITWMGKTENRRDCFKTRQREREILMYKHILKRFLDFMLSLLGLVILSPLFLVLVLAIKIDSKGPVLFKQKRVGRNKKYFDILKFRTMRIDTPHDIPTHMLKDPEQYITKMGKFLRKTSLDELPQLLNILAGQMAVIGPRPALWNQTDLIEARDQHNVNAVRPGLTGWAQINGRDELTIPEKVNYDSYYVEHLGFFFDIRCFFGTIANVLHHEGVVEGGTGAMKEQISK
jgi:O-antigen biosynthesis protein WbqP